MCKKIVIAEDDSDLRFILESRFTKAGYVVTGFPGGSDIVNNNYILPDLFIFDVLMQLIDGFALCKYLKLHHQTKDIPIIVISAAGEFETKALELGASHFMQKPLDIQKLLKMTDVIITRNQGQWRQNFKK